MDYLHDPMIGYFIGAAAMAFVVSALAAVRLHQLRLGALPWAALAVGLFMQAGAQLAILVGRQAGQPLGYQTMPHMLFVGAFVAQLEFARVGWGTLRGRTIGRWVLVAPLLLVAVSTVGGRIVINTMSRYFLALPAGLTVAAVLYVLSGRSRGLPAGWLRLSAVTMALAAVAIGAVPPPAPILPAALLNCQCFYATVGLPIQAFRAVLLSLSTLGITAFSAISTSSAAVPNPTRA